MCVQVKLVLAVLLQDLSNLASVLNLTQLNVALTLLNGLSNQLGGTGLTLCADNESLLLLASLVDQESSTLSILLGYLLSFNGSSEFGREGQVL